jgi:maltose phosphorylase
MPCFPFSEEYNVYLQQDGFLDKELVRVADLDKSQRPINQKWSWDRILRSPISNKPMFCNVFISLKIIFREELKNNFEFYESSRS